MTKYPNREALRKAHDIYRDAMREFIIRCLKRIQGATVEELVRDSLDDHGTEQFEQDLQRGNGSIEAAIDISNFPNIIGRYWKRPRGFSQEFGFNSKIQYKTGTIVEGRNLWAHPGVEDLDSYRTQADLTYIAEVLGEMKDKDAKEAVEDIRDRLFSNEPEEHPVEVENADLKERLANRDDELKAEKEQHQDTKNKLAKMEGMEAEWLEMDERYKAASKELTDARAENAELKKCLSEKEDRLKTVDSESAERIKTLSDQLTDNATKLETKEEALSTLSDQLTTVKEEKAGLEKRLKNLLKQPQTLKPESEERLQSALKQLKTANAVKTELEERLKTTSNRLEDLDTEFTAYKEHLARPLRQPVDRGKRNAEDEGSSEIKEWRRKIWKQLCNYAAQKDTSVRFHRPGSDNYLNVSRSLIDFTGFRMNVWLGTDNREIAIRLYMSKQDFYILEKQRKKIEQEFCESFEWEKLPQRRESRISLRKDIIDPTDESDWQNQHEWVISKLEKFHKKFNEVFLPRIQELNTSDSLNEVYMESQSGFESPAKSPKYQRKWRHPGAVAALRDPAEIQEAEAKIAQILNPSEKSRLERELREAKRALDGS